MRHPPLLKSTPVERETPSSQPKRAVRNSWLNTKSSDHRQLHWEEGMMEGWQYLSEVFYWTRTHNIIPNDNGLVTAWLLYKFHFWFLSCYSNSYNYCRLNLCFVTNCNSIDTDRQLLPNKDQLVTGDGLKKPFLTVDLLHSSTTVD